MSVIRILNTRPAAGTNITHNSLMMYSPEDKLYPVLSSGVGLLLHSGIFYNIGADCAVNTVVPNRRIAGERHSIPASVLGIECEPNQIWYIKGTINQTSGLFFIDSTTPIVTSTTGSVGTSFIQGGYINDDGTAELLLVNPVLTIYPYGTYPHGYTPESSGTNTGLIEVFAALPSPSSEYRGRLIIASTNSHDRVYVCIKNAADSYIWRPIDSSILHSSGG